MKNKQEKIFDNWLFESPKYKSKHNPFLEMFAEVHKNMPVVNSVDINKEENDEPVDERRYQ